MAEYVELESTIAAPIPSPPLIEAASLSSPSESKPTGTVAGVSNGGDSIDLDIEVVNSFTVGEQV